MTAPHFKVDHQELKLKQYVRLVLRQSYQEMRQTVNELKKVMRLMETQNRELNHMTDEQLRKVFAGAIIDGYDAIAKQQDEANVQKIDNTVQTLDTPKE